MKNIIVTLATLFTAFTTSFAATTISGSITPTSYQQGRKTVDNNILVSGGAHINANAASVSISGFTAGDSLILTDKQGLGNYSYNAATGVLTFSGNASAAEWQVIFRSVMFNRSNNSNTARTVSFQLDGASYSKMITTTASPLALTWVSFDGNASGSNVILNWKTADEKNTASFVIERSADGKNFEQIGSLKTVGTGNNSYDYTDVSAANGNNYYRLKQIDNDGTFQYSKVVTVTVRKETAIVSLFPNPAKDVLNIKSNTPVSVAIYNLNGSLVAAQDAAMTASVNISGLPDGFYIYRLTNGNEVVQTGKVQVIR